MKMTAAQIDQLFEEASKVLHLDQSHDAIRSKLQAAVSAKHRMDTADQGGSDYYNTPYVRDVFGDQEGGSVVHSRDGKLTMSKYKHDGKGNYAISNHKSVKQAYVADENKESFTLTVDGEERVIHESLAAKVELNEIIELQEANARTGTAKITLISAGKGSSGYYTEASLKKAAKDNVFAAGTQMFLNHQTKEERQARPEGDITKLAAKTTANAEYVEGEGGKPGRLVAPAKLYPEFAPFIAARKDDIGVSVRVGAEASGKQQEGVPLVENMVYALSADFVTKAGRGGKIEELYESFRATPEGQQQQRSENNMTEQELRDFKLLQESNTALQASNAKLTVTVDRLLEQNHRTRANNIVTEALAASTLPTRGQGRVRTIVLGTEAAPMTLPMKDGNLDVTALQEAVKKAVAEEVAYLQESGVRPQNVVRGQGATNLQVIDKDGKMREEPELLTEAAKVTDSSINSILGRKEKTA